MKRKTSSRSIPMAMGIGLLTSAIITFVGAMIVAALVASQKLMEEQIPYGAAAVLLTASMIGSCVTAIDFKEKRFWMCMAGGGLYILTLLCITAFFFDGGYQGVWVTCLMILGGSVAAGMLGVRTKGHKFRGGKYRPKLL